MVFIRTSRRVCFVAIGWSLSVSIVAAGSGPNVALAAQHQATDTSTYQVKPTVTGTYASLPQPNTTYASKACTGQASDSPAGRFPAALANAPYHITKYVPYFDGHGAYNSSGTCEFHGAISPVALPATVKPAGMSSSAKRGRPGPGGADIHYVQRMAAMAQTVEDPDLYGDGTVSKSGGWS